MSHRNKHETAAGHEQQTLSPLPEAVYSNPGTIRTLSTKRLTSGLPYQRPVRQEKVDDLVRRWNSRELHPIVVSFRDGKFNVVVGQNRIAAMRQMAGGGDVIVPCIIHTGMTYEDEANLYAKLETDRTPLTAGQHIKAVLEAGSDPKITEINRLVEESGFVWALDEATGEAFEISAASSLINAYHLLGGAAFSRMLALLAGTWQGTPYSLRASILSGMALFVKTYEAELTDRTFIKRMSAVSPEEIIRQGRIDNNIALRHARIIRENYNSLCGGETLPYRFYR